MTHIFNGKKTADHFLEKLTPRINSFSASTGTSPSLAIVRIGDNPSSALYVRNKLRTFQKLGLKAREYWFEKNISHESLCDQIQLLNEDSSFHGIIIQLPLPEHLISQDICGRIHPLKDVDGLTAYNQGLLFQGNASGMFPCTPLGCLLILKSVIKNLSGKKALIVGRSLLVGKPAALLLLQENATVTIAHSYSKDLSALAQEADILISAVGNPHFLKGDWIKEGAIILDVGTSQPPLDINSSCFMGDVDFDKALSKASFITPVPGGIGPMTIACLVYNTLKAAETLATGHPSFYDFSILEDCLIFS